MFGLLAELDDASLQDVIAPFLDDIEEEKGVDMSKCHSVRDVLENMKSTWMAQRWKVCQTRRWFELCYLSPGLLKVWTIYRLLLCYNRLSAGKKASQVSHFQRLSEDLLSDAELRMYCRSMSLAMAPWVVKSGELSRSCQSAEKGEWVRIRHNAGYSLQEDMRSVLQQLESSDVKEFIDRVDPTVGDTSQRPRAGLIFGEPESDPDADDEKGPSPVNGTD